MVASTESSVAAAATVASPDLLISPIIFATKGLSVALACEADDD
jgi:hypothetical protein